MRTRLGLGIGTKYVLGIACLVFLLACGSVHASPHAPDWLKAAAAQPVKDGLIIPGNSKLVLLDEETIRYDRDGDTREQVRYAFKILTSDGKDDANAVCDYLPHVQRVRSIRAWMIFPSGKVKEYGHRDTVDEGAFSEEALVDTVRRKRISASGDAEIGAVFGYETERDSNPGDSQIQWSFQDWSPVLESRLRITVPDGWKVIAQPVNGAAAIPIRRGDTSEWSMSDLTGRVDRPLLPQLAAIAPTLSINVIPPASDRRSRLSVFSSWPGVSAFTASLMDPRCNTDSALQAKAHSLTAGCTSEWDKVAAIGRYVQSLRYVAINKILTQWGGCEPHPAVDVFNNGFGDCKDKANLMRAMLRAVGIQAFPILAYLGDANFVQSDWPSPSQFNHAIEGICLNHAPAGVPVFHNASIGDWVLFDPTDSFVPLGRISEDLQGSWVLPVLPHGATLVRVPVLPASSDGVFQKTTASLDKGGTLTVDAHFTFKGTSAALVRSVRSSRNGQDLDKAMEAAWASSIPMLSKLVMTYGDDSKSHDENMETKFSARGYGRIIGGQLMLFRPFPLERSSALEASPGNRDVPVNLSKVYEERLIRIKLPAGYVVDDKPKDVSIKKSFGFYEAHFSVEDGELVVRTKKEVDPGLLPASAFPEVANFYRKISEVENKRVVLTKG